MWDTLNCREMVAAVGMEYDGEPSSMDGMPHATQNSPITDAYCKMYADLDDGTDGTVDRQATVRGLDYTTGWCRGCGLRWHHPQRHRGWRRTGWQRR